MWLRPEASPNWKVLDSKKIIPEVLWHQAIDSPSGLQMMDKLLQSTGS